MENRRNENSVSADSVKTELNIYKQAHPIKSLADGRNKHGLSLIYYYGDWRKSE